MPVGKCKLTQHWDATKHLVDWPKSRTLTQTLMSMWRNRSSELIAGRKCKWTASLQWCSQCKIALAHISKWDDKNMIDQLLFFIVDSGKMLSNSSPMLYFTRGTTRRNPTGMAFWEQSRFTAKLGWRNRDFPYAPYPLYYILLSL